MGEHSCEICGRPAVRAYVLIEGAKLLACSACMRGGTVIHMFEDDKEVDDEPVQHVPTPAFDHGEELIENVGETIRKARDRIKLPLSVVAERINEKESHLHGIENGRMNPSLELARKLEKELNVKLIDIAGEEVGTTLLKNTKFSQPTLADMLSSQKKRN